MWLARVAILAAVALPLGLAGCGDPPPAVPSPAGPVELTPDEIDTAVAGLVEATARRRAVTDFSTLPPWSARSGADPVALSTHGPRTVGVEHRGRLVVLDAEANVTAAASTVPGARTLAWIDDTVVVASETTGDLDIFDADTLRSRARQRVAEVASIRDVAWGEPERQLYLADPHRHRVMRVAWPSAPTTDGTVHSAEMVDACTGALAVMRVQGWLLYDCMLAHQLVIRSVAADGRLGPATTIEHDGPMWSMDAVATAQGGLRVLVGGVEDHPLDRQDGAFGFVDSYVFEYQVAPSSPSTPATAALVHALDVSTHGVITPKRVRWMADGEAAITGYGADVAVGVRWSEDPAAAPEVRRVPSMPGVTDFVGTLDQGLFANPLLDAWMFTRPGQAVTAVAVDDPTDDRTASERLGEALAFTGLMAPQATSAGRRSLFSCETCHFEGRTDGRTHWTGRGTVHATTKTLRGLFNNRPHFSRALDETTAQMVHAEFRVANTGTEQDPWFTLPDGDAPWLDALGVAPRPIDPVALRRALIDFLAAFTPEPNPAIVGQREPTAIQRRGAELFAAHCESCHRARWITDEPSSAVPPDRWFEYLLHPTGGIVWASELRYQTGVEPYVHAQGARVPSLRRLWVKRPLMTNGSAATVEQVLQGVRPGQAAVHGGGDGPGLSPDERAALAAFLDLM